VKASQEKKIYHHFLDDFSRFAMTKAIRTKNETFGMLQQIVAAFEKITGKTVARLYFRIADGSIIVIHVDDLLCAIHSRQTMIIWKKATSDRGPRNTAEIPRNGNWVEQQHDHHNRSTSAGTRLHYHQNSLYPVPTVSGGRRHACRRQIIPSVGRADFIHR